MLATLLALLASDQAYINAQNGSHSVGDCFWSYSTPAHRVCRVTTVQRDEALTCATLVSITEPNGQTHTHVLSCSDVTQSAFMEIHYVR